MIKYAYVKNNVVQDVLLFEDDASAEFLQEVKESLSCDEFVECNELNIQPGFLYNETEFYIEEGKKAFRLDEFNPDFTATPPTPEEIAAHPIQYPEQQGTPPGN